MDLSSLNIDMEMVMGYAQQIGMTLVVLFGGWLAAKIISWVVKSAFKKLNLDKKLSKVLPVDASKSFSISSLIGNLVFILLMVFVVIACLQIWDMSAVSEPLNGFLNQIFEYAPMLIGAAVLVGVAWLVATGVKFLINTLNIEKILKLEEEDGESLHVTSTFADIAYWLVFLLFLPAILGTLKLNGVLTPINSMLEKFLSFLPNLFAAAIIFVIGWFVAKIVKKILVNFMTSLGVNRLVEKVGLSKVFSKQSLPEVIGSVVYILILIPVLAGSLTSLKLDAITKPVSDLLDTFLQMVPKFFGAAIIIFISYIVGKIVSQLVGEFLNGVGFNNVLSKLGISDDKIKSKKSPSDIVAFIVLAAILLFATIEAFKIIGLVSISGVIAEFTHFAGQVLFGLIVLALGLFFANLVSDTISQSSAKNSKFLASVARISIIVLSVAMALKKMNVADEIVSLAFGLTLGGCALAFGLSFGLGARDSAGEIVKEFVKKLKS